MPGFEFEFNEKAKCIYNKRRYFSGCKGIPSYYNDIINSAITIDFPCKREIIPIRIARPEYLVVSKLTRNKTKDLADIVLLLNSMELDNYPFDSEEIRSILKSINKEEKYDILVELIDSV